MRSQISDSARRDACALRAAKCALSADMAAARLSALRVERLCALGLAGRVGAGRSALVYLTRAGVAASSQTEGAQDAGAGGLFS